MDRPTGMGIIEPQARIRELSNYGYVDVDENVPIRRYYRSGTEMVRMANVYLSEGNHENAYILYIKFMTLFLEKILSHPEYKTLPMVTKQPIKLKLKEVLPITEKLKAKLLDQYQREYTQFLANQEAEKAKELERAAKQQDSIFTSGSIHIVGPSVQPTAPDLSLLDKVVYPNDFPTGSNRSSNLPSSGLLLPDVSDKKSKPSFDRNQKPSAFDRSESLIEGALRTVIIPSDTMTIFLNLAKKNTQNNIETCGILAGSLAKNRLIISHIIIPKQNGTADSCTTMNEEEIFDIQDQKNLITLGWIHTHPTQTAFLSSVDLHTHCSYQIMMPEAIAIVCAPKYQTTGFYCLTPNYGLDFIAQCRQAGFHPHPNDPPLFMDATHIEIDNTAKIDVNDLRR